MATPFTIQRIPRALLNVIGNYGGQTPPELAQQVIGSLELLQMYGLTQLQSQTASNGAVAEGAGVSVTPSTRDWTVLFGAAGTVQKTATLTALWGFLAVNRAGGGSIPLDSREMGPFGATETGFATIGKYLPYPMLLPPNSVVSMNVPIIGTDATASVILTVEFGILG